MYDIHFDKSFVKDEYGQIHYSLQYRLPLGSWLPPQEVARFGTFKGGKAEESKKFHEKRSRLVKLKLFAKYKVCGDQLSKGAVP